MMQFLPIRACSRTCARCHTEEPSPINASGDTSAVSTTRYAMRRQYLRGHPSRGDQGRASSTEEARAKPLPCRRADARWDRRGAMTRILIITGGALWGASDAAWALGLTEVLSATAQGT